MLAHFGAWLLICGGPDEEAGSKLVFARTKLPVFFHIQEAASTADNMGLVCPGGHVTIGTMNKLKGLMQEVRHRKVFVGWFVLVIAIISFMLLYKVPNDPDLGWHLKTGELMIERGEVPRTDWFSHTLPDFDWVNHEYLTDIMLAAAHDVIGKPGLAIVFAALSTLLLFLLGQTARKKPGLLQSVLVGFAFLPFFYNFTGIRPQVLGWFFLLGVFWIAVALKRSPRSRWVYTLPLLFLLWANMHASVALGLVVLVVFVVTEGAKMQYFKNGKESLFLKKSQIFTGGAWRKFSIASGLAALATLINPYGIGIYQELLRTATDQHLSRNIVEWFSPNFSELNGITIFCPAHFCYAGIVPPDKAQD